MKILDRKDAINRRQDERLIIVETAIHRVSYLNQTVLRVEMQTNIFPNKKYIYRVLRNRNRSQ
ncbi:hypothetical protein [Nostoc sp. NMS8]|uniref:hypothetical protein n=1 Tax=Nostoc sp. NMS8 TaxID=2815392 RepID=UPI0025DD4B3C|nr:hypothetical protein [Nostoc sp. NMS8]MBN3960404.1 hypothetical protein [Nostoc sp. NMS8]